MSDVSKATCCVIDTGGWPYLAERLARDFGKVYYHSPLDPPEFPASFSGLLGQGMKNVERLKRDDLFRLFDGGCDFFVCTDVNSAGIQQHLRKLGHAVWGVGDAEEIEIDRWKLGEVLEEYNLARPDQQLLRGTDELASHLKAASECYVKLNFWRGDMETFHHVNWRLSEPWLLDRIARWGVARHEMEFIVQEKIEGVEASIDRWMIDGEHPETSLCGLEIKDAGYIGVVRPDADMPDSLREPYRKLAPFFKRHGSRGFFSAEGFTTKDGTFFLTDPCCRCPSPPMQLHCELWDNLPEVMKSGAQGIVVEPTASAKFGCVIILESNPDNPSQEIPIQFPREYERYVKFRDVYLRKGFTHVLPQSMPVPQVGATVGVGDSAEEAFEMAHEIAKSVEGYSLKPAIESFDKLKEAIEEAAKYGIEIS